MTLDIDVTAEDIQTGIPGYQASCAIALAAKRAGEAYAKRKVSKLECREDVDVYPWVDGETVSLTFSVDTSACQHDEVWTGELPDELSYFITEYDDRKRPNPDPVEFEMDFEQEERERVWPPLHVRKDPL